MSRIGIKPIKLPEGVNLELSEIEMIVSGPKGKISVALPHGIKVTQKDNILSVTRLSESKIYRSLHGTVRSLIQNAVTGVFEGFEKKLELIGIGYRGALEGNKLVLQLGYTHPVEFVIPENIAVKVEKNIITVTGHDKHKIGQFASEIRAARKPEPYKGKGVRYVGELVRMKQGKAVKGAGA
ncbi:50S ribosomal protein L6 [Candidatus Berkelbacteria bacterium]|nr:50S ribosomal protein L6 [Candidatus Berkelbacteria bacterium]